MISNIYKFRLMILGVQLLLFQNALIAQDQTNTIFLDKYKIQNNVWTSTGLRLDTLLKLNSKPFTRFIPACYEDTLETLSISIEEIKYNKKEKNLKIKGKLFNGEYGGWGTEAFIIAGTRIDTLTKLYSFHGGDFTLLDTIKCIELRLSDFCYTRCNFYPIKSEVNFDCVLKIDTKADVLIFAKSLHFAEIFDLLSIKKEFDR